MARRKSADDDRSDTDLLVEFCVEGTALSAQTKNRVRLRAWQSRIASYAELAGRGSLLDGQIEIRLSEFSETRSRDRDNVSKPIQDALQGILFVNDLQVARLESDWCDINGRYRVRFMSPTVAAALVAGREFVWVRVYRHRPRETLRS